MALPTGVRCEENDVSVASDTGRRKAMADQNPEGAPTEIPRGPIPTVFHFQPTRYEVVTGDRLEEWERLMRQRVGLPVEDLRTTALTALPSISYCDYACDCDVV